MRSEPSVGSTSERFVKGITWVIFGKMTYTTRIRTIILENDRSRAEQSISLSVEGCVRAVQHEFQLNTPVTRKRTSVELSRLPTESRDWIHSRSSHGW